MTKEELKHFKAALSITAVAADLGVPVVRGRCKCFFPQRHAHGDRTPSVSFSEEEDCKLISIRNTGIAPDSTDMENIKYLIGELEK